MPLGRLNDGLGRPNKNKNTLLRLLGRSTHFKRLSLPTPTHHTKIVRSHQQARHNADRRSLTSSPSNTTTMSLTSNSWLRGQTHVRAQTHPCRVGVHLRRRPPATPLAVAFQTDAYRTDDASPACITPLRRLANDPFAVVSPERGFLPSRDPLQRCDRSLVCCCVCVGYD